jgi:holin-like protein
MLKGLTWFLIAQLAGEACMRITKLPVPGPVLGMVILFTGLMLAPAIRTHIGESADLLLAHLSLLFIPAGVGVVLYLRELAQSAWALTVVLLVSTWVGLAVTAWVAQFMLDRQPHE